MSRVAEWSKGTVEHWATETLAAAKMAYRIPGSDEPLKPGTKLGDEYFRYALPIVEIQPAKSGVGVALVLNEVFK